MKSMALRSFAAVLSVTLVAGLIYYRSGWLFADSGPENPDEVMMGGSKSAKVFLWDGKQPLAGEPPDAESLNYIMVTDPQGRISKVRKGTPPDVLVPDDDGSSFSVGINPHGFTPNLDTKWGTMILREDVEKAISPGSNSRTQTKP